MNAQAPYPVGLGPRKGALRRSPPPSADSSEAVHQKLGTLNVQSTACHGHRGSADSRELAPPDEE
jgi:hypothetical protein